MCKAIQSLELIKGDFSYLFKVQTKALNNIKKSAFCAFSANDNGD